MRARCLVRGSINIDEFFHVPKIVQPGETLSSTHYERRAGGKGANQAVAVAKAGGAVTLVGAVGEDGDWVVRGLQEANVDVSSVVVDREQPTGRAIIQLTPDGENSIILHRGANYSAIPDRQTHSTLCTHLLLQNEIPFPSTLNILSSSHKAQATTLFNPSPLPTSDQLRSFPWDQLDWLIVNEGEATGLLTAIHGPDALSTSEENVPSDWPDDSNIRKAISLLRQLHVHPKFSSSVNVVCTLGSLGVVALLGNSDEALYVPAAPLDKPVLDTTGAGDCFTGYLVAGLMDDHKVGGGGSKTVGRDSLEKILNVAVQAAGICVTRRGATESIPMRDEVNARMMSH